MRNKLTQATFLTLEVARLGPHAGLARDAYRQAGLPLFISQSATIGANFGALFTKFGITGIGPRHSREPSLPRDFVARLSFENVRQTEVPPLIYPFSRPRNAISVDI